MYDVTDGTEPGVIFIYLLFMFLFSLSNAQPKTKTIIVCAWMVEKMGKHSVRAIYVIHIDNTPTTPTSKTSQSYLKCQCWERSERNRSKKKHVQTSNCFIECEWVGDFQMYAITTWNSRVTLFSYYFHGSPVDKYTRFSYSACQTRLRFPWDDDVCDYDRFSGYWQHPLPLRHRPTSLRRNFAEILVFSLSALY